MPIAGSLLTSSLSSSSDLNLTSLETDAPAFTSPGDGFGVFQRGDSIPFSLADDSLSIFASDTLGIVGEDDTDPFFGVTDTENGDNSGPVSATWTFGIGSQNDLSLSIDMAAMGDFETSDHFIWEVSIDGGDWVTVFTSSVDEDGARDYTMDGGAIVSLNDPMSVNGTPLTNDFQTVSAALSGTGSELRVRLTAQTDGGSEGMAFRNIAVEGGLSRSVIAAALGAEDLNLAAFSTDAPEFGSAGDGFAIFQRGVSPSIPFAVLDDSLAIFTPDSLGVIKDGNTDPFFGVTDTENADNAGPVSAEWSFAVNSATNLELSIDMGAMGDFEADDWFTWEYRLDGGGWQSAFASAVDETGSQTYTLEGGASFTLDDPITVNGTVLTDDLQTFTAALTGTGTQLDVRLTAQTDGSSEAMAFQNIEITGSAPRVTVASDLSAAAPLNRVSFVNDAPAFSSAGDGFGVFQRAVSPSIPFALLDDTVSVFPPDTLGIIGEDNLDPFFGVTDTVNGDTAGPVTATWVFDVMGVDALELSIDMGAMGDFESADQYLWEYAIDGGPFQTAFDLVADEDSSLTYTLDSGTLVTLDDPLTVAGIVLTNEMQTVTTALAGSGNQLTLRLTADTDGSEAVAFQNLNITGITDAPVGPAVLVGQSGGSTEVSEDGATDSYTLALNQAPESGAVTVQVTSSDGQLEFSTDGVSFSDTLNVDLGDTAPLEVFVRAMDDAVFEGSLHQGTITHSIAESGDPAFNDTDTPIQDVSVEIAENDFILTAIPAIQGGGQRSALEGSPVLTTGIVTALESNGFFIQDLSGDGDAATSDGLFVFTGSAPLNTDGEALELGDEVKVEGTVTEFRPGFGTLTLTELTDIFAIEELSTGNGLPAPVVIGQGGFTPPTESIEEGIAFYEQFEGMLVTISDAMAIAPTDDGDIYVVADQGANATGLSSRNTLTISEDPSLPTPGQFTQGDFNPERIKIDVDGNVLPGFGTPLVGPGDLLGNVTGVLRYDNEGFYELVPTKAFAVTETQLSRETGELEGREEQLTISSFNVLNLDPSDGSQFDELATLIANNMHGPDVIGLQEIQDNSGASDDGTVSADETLQMLVDAIAAAGGPVYEYIDNTFIGDNTSGGAPGGNIRTGFLYNPERVSLVEGSVTTVAAEISHDDPANPFYGSRLPIVADFTFGDEVVTVVNNHFSSKGGSEPLFGENQPPLNGSWDERARQSEAVRDYVAALLAAEPDANVAVVGDLNEFQFFQAVENLKDAGLTSTWDGLDEEERYSYLFQGNTQALDHILVADGLDARTEFDAVHVNAEFADQASDHDPLVARIDFADYDMVLDGTLGDDERFGGNGDQLLRGRAGDDTLNGGNGDDRVVGDDGDDFLIGENGDDLLDGGAGNDRLAGRKGDDRMFGDSGDDDLFGDNGDDHLDGGVGNDWLKGGNGDDVLVGGAGDDQMNGGNGADMFVLRGGEEGDDLIVDFKLGVDMLVLEDGAAILAHKEDDLNGDGMLDTLLTLDAGTVTLRGVTGFAEMTEIA
ncbi:endonuclease/exonuclease/phosphatase family protein [Halovulum sp. GXIMD14794]